MFIEYPAIDGRVLMGAKPPSIGRTDFSTTRSASGTPRADHDGTVHRLGPASWTTYHGDGSWTCVGPGGTPLPTIRLENFRDGLEDYAYVRVLESLVEQVAALVSRTAQQDTWLTQARQALVVPDELARSMTEFTADPAVVYRGAGNWHGPSRMRGIAPAIRNDVVRKLTEKKHEP